MTQSAEQYQEELHEELEWLEQANKVRPSEYKQERIERLKNRIANRGEG